MASFYGTGVIVGSGGGEGTTNYNDLENKPIINLIGVLPVDLSILEVGTYNIRGNYKYNENGDTHTFAETHLVQVFQDSVTQNKIVRFDIYKDDKRYTQSIIYDNTTGIYTEELYPYSTLVVSDTANLPEQGDVTKLYIRDDGIYVWTGTDYQKLGTQDAVWESF